MKANIKKDKSSIKVLIVFANPRNTDPLRLGEEDRAIREAIQLSPHRDKIMITVRHAATIHDLRRALLADEFQIVHISGHGGKDGLALEDEIGRIMLIPQAALADLLQAYSPPIQCVLLNACYSISQGKLASLGIPFTIAMEDSISDRAAIEFSRGFYDAIGAGRTIDFAYEEGCRTVNLAAPTPHFVSQILTQDKNLKHFCLESGERLPWGYALIQLGSKRIAMKPTLYQSLRELLDDLYMSYLADQYNPYSYGQKWIIASSISMKMQADYLIAPWNWLFQSNMNQPISKFDREWASLPPVAYRLVANQQYQILELPIEPIIGVATNSISNHGDPHKFEMYLRDLVWTLYNFTEEEDSSWKLVLPESTNSKEYQFCLLLFLKHYYDADFLNGKAIIDKKS